MGVGVYATVMFMANKKQQSAMEYLMTYGWSILIIAIVLAALFSLGVFSNSNLGPRAQPNSCRVFRPNGPGTTSNINLEGVCNGELPQYVGEFDGVTSYVSVSSVSGMPVSSNARSVFLWINPSITDSGYHTPFGEGVTGATANAVLIRLKNPGTGTTIGLNSGAGTVMSSISVPQNTWSFVGFTYVAGASTSTVYVNTQSQSIGVAFYTTQNTLYLGREAVAGQSFPGMIADVQVYNTTLDSTAIQALYLEGIGGAPVEPQYLVAWWPLDGDTNDYSGNGNNGAATSVTFTSSWTSGYTAP